MLSANAKEKLKDPDYFKFHLAAVEAIRSVGETKWYDAHFLRRYEATKLYLENVRPDALDQFIAGFAPLKPAGGDGIKRINGLFDEDTRIKIKQAVKQVPDARLERHEMEAFGRHVVHDHPYFLELQAELLPVVSELAGCELKTGYNFLSLYGGAGKCEPHMDEPVSMYTLDYCIDQSEEWPIQFSQIVDWPDAQIFENWNPQSLLNDPKVNFTPQILKPNDALLFTGSSQWHYRDNIPEGGFCHLLFFHYYPASSENLVYPSRWQKHFDIPELGPICDLFRQSSDDGLD